MPHRTRVIAVALYPGFSLLCAAGSIEILQLGEGLEVMLVAGSPGTVPSDSGIGLEPTCTFTTAPAADVLLVPGGSGVAAAMDDAALLGYLRRTAHGAALLGGLGSGALLLGAAGLLRGRRATTHWSDEGLLARFGAAATGERISSDGHVFTCSGISAAMTLTLHLLAILRGAEAAHHAALTLGYDPQPDLTGGNPDAASQHLLAAGRARSQERLGPSVARAVGRLAESDPLEPW
jgi:cyclohexyl-isocyanide hydratase